MAEAVPQYTWLDQQGEAPGAPGLPPRWTSSIKNMVGTAYSASSRLWYTLSHGIVNELYYPTIDRPQVRDLEFLITDGETFFHEEKRDLDRSFSFVDPNAPATRQVNKDREARYTLTKETITDPHAPVLLIRVRLEAEAALLPRLKIYALLAPHLDGGGAGNSARVLDLAGRRAILAWKGGTSLCMTCDRGFSRASCGFVGVSDGWQDLHDGFKMDWEYGSAHDGNLALMGEVDLNQTLHSATSNTPVAPAPNAPARSTASSREFVLAIGFGEGHHAALSATMSSLSQGFDGTLKRFLDQWRRVQSPVELSRHAFDSGKLMRVSQNVILTHEDKTYNGAFIASLSIPWGFAKGDDDLGGYHLVWTRDMVQSASALLACGRTETALRALVYLACTQKPDGGFAQNFWVNGTPYWTGVQLDEVAFPIILAWRLWKLGGLGKFDVFPFTARAAGFLVRHAPVTQQERWEEAAGYSPSTLAAVITALICAAELAHAHGAPELGTFLEEHADWVQSHLEEWTVTNDGVLDPDVKRHYIRVRPPATGEPWAQPDNGNGTMLRLNNRAPGERSLFEAREIVDAGFLELVRYGVRRADDPLIIDSLKVVDRVLKVDAPQGPCWRRYNHDGYGEKKGGGAFLTWGQGRAWPLLTGERAHYELAAGQDVSLYVKAMEGFASPGGMLPEQIWDYQEPLVTPAGVVKMGDPAGSAMPLVWAHAEYLKLLRSIEDGAVYDRVSSVEARYGGGPVESRVEIFKLRRPIRSILAGKTLRIISGASFEVRWTADGWSNAQLAQSRSVGYAGWFADLPTDPQGRGKLSFTIFWTTDRRWEGRDFDVELRPRN
jgi:glucoamylase